MQLRFYARGTALVADVHAQEHPTHPVRRFIGRRWQEVAPGEWGWCPTEAPQSVEYHHDLARACRDGDLWPADAETAKALNVPFDPNFGDEETETIKAWRARAHAAQVNAPGPTTSDDARVPRRPTKGESGGKDES